jgi:hypothetical protein
MLFIHQIVTIHSTVLQDQFSVQYVVFWWCASMASSKLEHWHPHPRQGRARASHAARPSF